MKHNDFSFLQLFAEDVNTAVENTENSSGENAEESAPEKNNPEKKYTDADLDEIINRKFARWQKEQQKKTDEAAKLAEMNAVERAKYEKEQLENELNEYKRKDSIAKMIKTARNMLSESNISVSDELISMFVGEDAEKTKIAVESFAGSFNAAVEHTVKERLRGETPRKGTAATKMTKEEIMKIADQDLRQQKMLENRELFNF